jgi:cytochrome c-type biogenesis protein
VQTLAFTEASAFRGALLSLGYCFGLGLPFIATGLFLDKSEKLRKFLTRNGRVISLIGGALLILIGILQVSGVWNSLMIDLRSVISEFAPVI